MRSALLAAVLTVLAPPVAAIAPGTVCFGNEPSWSLRFHDERRATLSFPDTGARELRGRATMLAPLREWMWRGRSANGGDLVAFISEAACSDNMSDLKHPTTVRASLPDHRFLAGCCRIAQAQGASGFEGRTWTLTDLPAAPANLPAGRNAVTARFENGRVSGFAACNTFTGSYAKEGGRLVVGSIAATMMACPEPAMTLERTVLRALTGSFRVDVADRSLTLSSESGSAIRFAEAAQPKLEGVQWKVTGFNNGRQAVLSPRLGTTLSVGFENGAVRGNAGCNTFRGTYTVNGGRIAIRALAATRKLCREEGVMEQEREFLAALESTVRWTIERGMLDMRGADGARTLTATRNAR